MASEAKKEEKDRGLDERQDRVVENLHDPVIE